MNPEQRITFDPEVCGGRPCIRGMRIRVSDILEMLGHGADIKEILADFPDLEEADIRASLLYAARRTDFERLAALGFAINDQTQLTLRVPYPWNLVIPGPSPAPSATEPGIQLSLLPDEELDSGFGLQGAAGRPGMTMSS